jgi:outer membrane protein OmpA-like peptidoglycan-associated protein
MKTRSGLARSLLAVLPLLTLASVGLAPRTALAQKITFGGGGGGASSATPASTAAPAAAKPATTTAPPAAAKPAEGAAATKEETKEEEEKPTEEWQARDSAVDEGNSLYGGMGLIHTMHAQPGKGGQFRMGFTAEFMSAGFLCTTVYPCPNPAGGSAITKDSTNHVGGTINLSASIIDYVEAYASTDAYANANDNNRPTLLQVLGDLTLGVKAAYDFNTKFFWVGFAPELHLLNGAGAVGLNGSSTSARFVVPATLDLRQMQSKIPFRASLNLAYSVDNSSAIVADTETKRGQPVTRIERFGLGINRVDHFDVHLGAETFLLNDRIRPFIEFDLLGAINRQGYACHAPFTPKANPSNDNCLANDTIPPTNFTLGARFFPWKHGFSLLAAVDIGMTGVANFIEELAPTAPYMVYLGAGWAIDTWDRPPVEKIKTIEKKIEGKPAPRGHLKGFVHEKDKTDAIPGAVVAWDNHPELTSLYTGPDGRFTTQELLEGNYTFAVKAEGYKDGTCGGQLTKAGNDVQVDCALEALPRVGTLLGHVRDGETNAPVPSASVKFKDATGKELSLSADSQGAYRFEGVAPGQGEISVEAPDYLAYVDHTAVKVRQENTFDAMIRHKPKKSLVNVTAKEITIKQQIQFALDQDVILPESTPLLLEIADVLIKNPRIKQVEVQGHTDNTGTPEHNQDLSDRRAGSVRTWLVQHGVSPDRLVAKGYGQTKPLVPNVTTANKAKNRRVQFIILDQDKPETGGGGGHTAVPF